MKTTSALKNLKKELSENNEKVNTNIENIIKSFDTEIISQKKSLLKKIASDYDLNYTELSKKYITPLKKKKGSKEEEVVKNRERNNSAVLEKVEIKGKTYYIENEEGGNIYTQDVQKIGVIKDNEYVFEINDL